MSATGSRRREGGFTLIEALTTISIAAMIGGLMFPAIDRAIPAIAFQQAQAGLRADLRMARAQALYSGRAVDLTVDGNGSGYGWTPGPQRVLIAGLSLGPAGSQMRFFADGSSSGGRLVLSRGARQARFEVAPQTGVADGSS